MFVWVFTIRLLNLVLYIVSGLFEPTTNATWYIYIQERSNKIKKKNKTKQNKNTTTSDRFQKSKVEIVEIGIIP